MPAGLRGPSRPVGRPEQACWSREGLERVLQTSVREVRGLAARVRQILFSQHQGDIQRASGHRNAMRKSSCGSTGTPTTIEVGLILRDKEEEHGGRGER